MNFDKFIDLIWNPNNLGYRKNNNGLSTAPCWIPLMKVWDTVCIDGMTKMCTVPNLSSMIMSCDMISSRQVKKITLPFYKSIITIIIKYRVALSRYV